MRTKPEDLIQISKTAIRGNFPFRNAQIIVGNQAIHNRMKRDRREILREWLLVLRYASKASNLEKITAALKDQGALAAHQLRALVILACEF
ncbi:MAG: hypothetical protein ACTS9Y_00415 [Methylophilus sp.]|uniref:hypothetical protein n=1 Tax=Methylophilus sp. TaxID=29541 RepID=UPI003FA181F3